MNVDFGPDKNLDESVNIEAANSNVNIRHAHSKKIQSERDNLRLSF